MMLQHAANGIFSFSLVPLRLATWAGLTALSLAFLCIGYAVVTHFFTDAQMNGWTLLLIAILFLGGGQFLFIGIVGEYLGRIANEVRRRPLYLVQERLGFPPP